MQTNFSANKGPFSIIVPPPLMRKVSEDFISFEDAKSAAEELVFSSRRQLLIQDSEGNTINPLI